MKKSILMLLRFVPVFAFAAMLVAQEADYGGPSILSRGLMPSVSTRHVSINFRPRLGIRGSCDNGLTAVSIDSSGHVPNVFSCGVEANAGLSGYHTWKRTRVGLDYAGDYRHYPRTTFYDGTDQFLSLGLTHQLSKHVAIGLREAAGTYSRNYFGVGGAGVYDPAVVQQAAPNIFDSPVIFFSTGADLTYLLSARWSINAGGSAFADRFRSTALYGATSYGAHGDIIYRYSRYGSIGVVYQYLHTDFTKSFGAFDYHVLGIAYSIRPAKSVELQFQVGAGRVESLTVERVAIDPIIAAITGQTSGVLAAYHLNYIPDLAGGLTKTFRNGTLSGRYTRSISIGNGVYLASRADTVGGSYSYTGVRRWSFSLSGGYNKLSSIQQTLGVYSAYTAGAGLVRTLAAGLQFSAQVEERRYDTGYVGFRRDALRVGIGFTWTPGDVPLTLW